MTLEQFRGSWLVQPSLLTTYKRRASGIIARDRRRSRCILGSAVQQLPTRFQCEECRAIARSLQDAWRADNDVLRAKVRNVAVCSGRNVGQFAVDWVFSVATMPDEEMKVLLDSHYPTVIEVDRKREAHEIATGHSLKSWRMLLHYDPTERE
jgi:hypothetical protein